MHLYDTCVQVVGPEVYTAEVAQALSAVNSKVIEPTMLSHMTEEQRSQLAYFHRRAPEASLDETKHMPELLRERQRRRSSEECM